MAGRIPGAIAAGARRRGFPSPLLWSALTFAALAVAAAGCGNPTGDASPSPPPFDVLERTIPELQAAMEDGRVTSRQIVAQHLARIAAYDDRGPALNAMIALNGRALEEADALDRERAASGPRGPLHGIPVVVKDNFDVAGLPTTAGAIALAGWYPPDDAFQVARLKAAGAVIIGKANMHELAYGMTTVSSAGGQTRNPYDPSRNPGGSSGGTGAAVAANYAAAGMGTDTCGSIRMPSFHHALAGLRATQGLSSRDGIVPLALTQDMGGPLAKTVTDLALVLDATAGFDPADEVTARGRGHIPASYADFLTEGALAGARIGVVTWLVGEAPEDEPVAAVIRAALETMEAAGAEVIDVELPGVPDLLQGGSVVPVEFKFQLADYLAAPGTPVKSLRQILDSGLYHAAVEERYRNSDNARGLDDPDYLQALARREPLREAVTGFLDEERLDALAYPTLRRTAAPIGLTQHGNNCALSAVSGLPALVVPAGYAADGMPVGIELLGRAWDEGELIRLAYSYEQLTRHRRAPAHDPQPSGRRPRHHRHGVDRHRRRPGAARRHRRERPGALHLEPGHAAAALRRDRLRRTRRRRALHPPAPRRPRRGRPGAAGALRWGHRARVRHADPHRRRARRLRGGHAVLRRAHPGLPQRRRKSAARGCRRGVTCGGRGRRGADGLAARRRRSTRASIILLDHAGSRLAQPCTHRIPAGPEFPRPA